MTRYLYPQNLKAKANLWFWSLKHFCIIGVTALISIFVLVNTGILFPAVLTLCYGFMTIQIDETTILDFLTYAVRYFITIQQYFEWR